MSKFDVCMVGLGPVGTTSGLCFAKQGYKVIGVDINQTRVDSFKNKKAPFIEPGIDDLTSEAIDQGNFSTTTDLLNAAASSDIIMIAVGTPTPVETGVPDLSYLDSACGIIGKALLKSRTEGTIPANGAIVVVRSTVPPGTMRNRLAKIIEESSGLKAGVDFHVAANPEFLREGKAIQDFFNTGRVVVGADSQEAAERIMKLYRDVKADSRLIVSLESAEFAKYVDNTWHALKVAFANEIGRVCVGFGGRPEETTNIFLSDKQLNISPYYLRPGFAFGGSCLPKDTRGITHLAKKVGVQVPVIESILRSNDEHIERGVNLIMSHKPSSVGLLGVAFKEHVDDLREAPALAVAASLMKRGIKVAAHDVAFKAGDKLKLPGTKDELEIVSLDDLQTNHTLALIHRLPQYISLQNGMRNIVDLTTITE